MSLKSTIIIDKLRAHFHNYDKKLKTFEGKIQIKIKLNGIIGQILNLDLFKMTITDDDTDDVDMKIIIDDDDFYLVGTQQTTLKELLNLEKIDVTGDMELLGKLDLKFNRK